ncbi:dihydropteroate synthase [Acetobacter sp. DsW_063]|uniref:dihydropteroate synthase n=1 Tax=Acetobacter sp. DsW_063 TaxID=1514894 RepID=UPI000A3779AD|nr:dihydropteroate synthase [Acetobacter sp. DsW_063]OUJ16152.1 dihydropteroate synthase [Acetobacter sp. DsW_063]
MDAVKLVEPAGLLYGNEAVATVKAGVALPLAGGPAAFALAFLWDGAQRTGPVPVERIPAGWREAMRMVTTAPPSCGLPAGTTVMGILNVTPDSFSDGGDYESTEAATRQIGVLQDGGARIIDVGAESTRPGAAAVSLEDEWRRLKPAVERLRQAGAVISVDTRNARTMGAAVDAGAALVNDVSALRHDRDAAPMLATKECAVALMHMRGEPATMNMLTDYHDIGVDVVRELAAAVRDAENAGIDRSRLLVDPGFGFAKTSVQNYELLRRLPILANLGCRVLVGVSRKRMIGDVTGVAEARLRDPGTVAANIPGLVFSDAILRVHDAQAMTQAVKVWEALCATA